MVGTGGEYRPENIRLAVSRLSCRTFGRFVRLKRARGRSSRLAPRFRVLRSAPVLRASPVCPDWNITVRWYSSPRVQAWPVPASLRPGFRIPVPGGPDPADPGGGVFRRAIPLGDSTG